MALPPTPVDRHRHRLTHDSELTVLVLVGLPARGKSFISKKLERFLQWRGDQVKIFNVGERRRKHDTGGKQDAKFFGADNRSIREQIAHGVLLEMVHWLRSGVDPSECTSRAPAPPPLLPAETTTAAVGADEVADLLDDPVGRVAHGVGLPRDRWAPASARITGR